jgi:phosphohistidine phosphatase SixA
VAAVRVYLVQHGLAESADDDPLRPLTGEGADDVSRVARLATSRLGVQAERIVHSGKTRARETAEIWLRYSVSTLRRMTVSPPTTTRHPGSSGCAAKPAT